MRTAGYDIGFTDAEYAERREIFQTLWGTGVTINFLAPSLADDERLVEEWARYERMIATPNSILAAFDVVAELDVRDLLPRVSTRTLVDPLGRERLRSCLARPLSRRAHSRRALRRSGLRPGA